MTPLLWQKSEVESEVKSLFSKLSLHNLIYADDTTLMAEKWRGTKEPLDESERGKWKGWLKTQIQKTKIMASSAIHGK